MMLHLLQSVRVTWGASQYIREVVQSVEQVSSSGDGIAYCGTADRVYWRF
jgi:hypothetical protein